MADFIILPKKDTTAPIPDPSYDEFEIPENTTNTKKIEFALVFLQKFSDQIVDLDKRYSELSSKQEDLKLQQGRQSNKNIEIIGVFCAVLAILIIDSSIIKSAPTFLSAVFLMVGMTASVALFAALMHEFFSEKPSIVPRVVAVTSVITLLLLVGLGFMNGNMQLIEAKEEEDHSSSKNVIPKFR